jgi:transposase
MRAYSLDLRERIVAARLRGEPTAVVAARFGVARRTVERYVRQQRTTGELASRPRPGRRRRLSAAQAEQLHMQLRLMPSATLAEHCAALERTTGVRVSIATMARAIHRLGWTRKKGHWQPVSRSTPPALTGGRPS